MKRISLESIQGLSGGNQGLTPEQVQEQRSRFGENTIIEETGHRWVEVLKETFQDPMIWFLVGIGFVFYLVGQISESVTLFVAILPLTLMDSFLHWRTQASTESLRGNLSHQVKVLRGGSVVTLDAKELVPGDIVILSTGFFVPADGSLESAEGMQVDESVLTGEAFPIKKIPCDINLFEKSKTSEDVLLSPEVLLSAGTRVLTGEGRLRVLQTGASTTYGEIVRSVSRMPHERTPLQKGISDLVKVLIYISAAFCILLAGIRMYQGHGWLDAILSAATLAVAAIPEEFPVVFTFFLGVGIFRLAQRHALVRRAVSVENIGRVTQICTDKTGTITVGELSLTHFDVGDSADPKSLLIAATSASNPEGKDPVDIAIFKSAQAKGIVLEPVIQRFPFTEDRKKESALVKGHQGSRLYVKGSPETILNLANLSEEKKIEWQKRVVRWAREGHKVLACAQKVIVGDVDSLQAEPQSDFDFIGLLAFEDPPRAEVPEAIQYAYNNEIRVLMITGDHPETAAAIARDVGLGGAELKVLSAEDFPEKFEKEYLDRHPDFLRSLDVVSRCQPLQKLYIVEALKKAGELVAVTGDGVNDVPALKAADVGIAMGSRGTRTAKEVSSIILADDNFKTIVAAIMEGRQLFANLKMAFEYLLLIHMPFVLTAAFVPLFGYPLIYLPAHIVWLELVIHPSAILAFQSKASVISRKSSQNFFSKKDQVWIIFGGALMAIVLGGLFIHDLDVKGVEYARGKALVLLSLWSASLLVSFTHLKNRSAQVLAIGTVVFAIVVVQLSHYLQFLRISPLQVVDWMQNLLIVFLVNLLMLGLRKTVSNKFDV